MTGKYHSSFMADYWGMLSWLACPGLLKMFAWLANRRTRKQAAESLSMAIAQLQENLQTTKQALAVCEKWAQICDSQAAQLAEARAENARLLAVLSSPKELQAEAEQLEALAQVPCGRFLQ